MKSIQYSLDRFTASWQELQADLIDSGFIKLVVDTGTTVVNILDKIVEGTHGVAAGAALIAGAYVWVNKVIKEGTKATAIDTAANEANAQSKRNQAAASALHAANNVVETESTAAETSATVANTAASEANIVVKANQAIGKSATAAGTAVATGAKTAAAGIKSVGTAVASTVAEFAPLLVVVGIVVAGAAALIDKFVVTSKEASENLQKSTTDLSSTSSELDDVESKIDDIQAKLDDDSYLSVTNKDEITNLEIELDYLKQKQELLLENKRIQEDSVADDAHDVAFNTQGWGKESIVEEGERLQKVLDSRREEIKRAKEEYEQIEDELDKQVKFQEIQDLESNYQKDKDALNDFKSEHLTELFDAREKMAKQSEGLYNQDVNRIDSLLNKLKDDNDEAVKDTQANYKKIEKAITDSGIKDAVIQYQTELQQAIDLGYLDKDYKFGDELAEYTIGNIDTAQRKVLNWSEANIDKYREALESWGENPVDYLGSYSTVDSRSDYFDGVEIAFTPIFNGENGPEYLDRDTVTSYIQSLIDEANKRGLDWQNDESVLLNLDKEQMGLLFGQDLNGSEVISHLAGKDGSLKSLENEINNGLIPSINGLDLELADGVTNLDAFSLYLKNAKVDAEGLDAAISNIDILSDVQSLSKGMDQIDKIYADVLNKEDFDFSSILNNEDFEKTFGKLDGVFAQFGDAYTNFVEIVANNPDDIQATQEAFDNLASAYIYQTTALGEVTEETKDATVEMLKQMGVVNAEEVVAGVLANKLQDLAWAESVAAENGIDLASVTSSEVNQLIDEGAVSEETGKKLAYYALQKQIANQTDIWTETSCKQLQHLANVAGITSNALIELTKVQAKIASVQQTINSVKNSTDIAGGAKLVGAIGELSVLQADAKKLQAQVKADIANAEVGINAPQIKYGGGSATQSAIDKAAGSAKEDTEELFDYFERRVEVLNQAIELLGANLENVLGSVAKNQLLDSQRGIYRTELDEYSAALDMYQKKANEFLVKLPADIQQKIVNGAVALQDFVGDSEGEVLEAIKSYQEWANKVADCTQKLAELKETLRQLELQKFNNIVDEFSTRFDIRQNTGIDLIEKQISLFEEAGEAVGRGFYDVQAQQTQLQLEDLNREKELLIGQLQSAIDNGVSAGTDEWEEMVKDLADVDSSILEAKTSLEKFDNAILKLHTETFDRIQKRFDAIGEEISAMDSFFEEADVANEGNQWTNEGLARLGLQTQAYELATRRVQQYNDEIADLGLKYMDGKYSAREYTDELDRLKSEQLKEAQNAESAKKSIMELNQARVDIVVEGINKEVEAYKKLTDEMVKALDSEEALHDYQQNIAESNKDITKLERKIAAMQNDNTAATVAKRKKLEEELAEARAQLAEKQHDHDVETRKNALNEEYENYEEEKNAEIEKLQESLKEQESIIAASFETVKLNAQAVGETISAEAKEHGVQISTALTDSWGAGEGAIASYGTVLDEKSSAFVLKLGEVETSEWNIQTNADNASVSIANLFGQKASGLITELDNANISAQNLAGLSAAIRSGFQNAFSEYNTSGIIGSLNAVKQAAEQTASALRDAQAMDTNSSGSGQSAKDMYQTPGEKFNAVKWNNPAQQKWRKTHGYATGGHKLLNDELAWTQELGDEVILSPTRNAILTPLRQGDSVLTAKQSEVLFQWAKTSPAEFMRKAVAGKTVIPASNVGDMKLEIGNVLTVNGNIDDTNVKRMESVAQDAINKAFVQLKNGLKR